MEDKQILDSYIPLVNFLGEVFGEDCEVVLHNTKNIEKSVIAISNNLSGRNVGGPLTDLSLSLLSDPQYKGKKYITKYVAKTLNGEKTCSSTFFIENKKGDRIGLLCINISIGKLKRLRSSFDSFMAGIYGDTSIDIDKNTTAVENLSLSVEDLVMSIIENTLSESNVPPDMMSISEKMNIVSKLNEKGVFQFKGALSEVAGHLKTSENTIYRYLNKLE